MPVVALRPMPWFAFALALAACNGGSGQSTAPPPPPDMAHGGETLDPGLISRGKISVLEAETDVAASAAGAVAVVWITEEQNGGSGTGYAISLDDGVTFSAPVNLASPGLRVSSDPVVAADAQGNFYVTWLGFKRDTMGNAYDMHTYVSRADAGTTTFGTPVEASTPQNGDAYDKPWITVLPDGSILVTWTVTSDPVGILASRSTDGGATWSVATVTSDNTFRNLVFPCHGESGGRVYVTYSTGGGIGLRWSDDYGVTWPDGSALTVSDAGEQAAFDDPTCVVAGSEVWVSYGLTMDTFSEAIAPKLTAIRIAHSPDGGKTIDHRFDAHDGSAGTFFLHPFLAREGGGALDLVYYAGNFDMDPAGSLLRARSTDGGATWGSSVVIHAPIDFLAERDSDKWLGDYAGLAWARDNLYVSYVDNGGIGSHIGFYRTAAPPLP